MFGSVFSEKSAEKLLEAANFFPLHISEGILMEKQSNMKFLKKSKEKVFNFTDFCPLKINEGTLKKFCTTMKILTPTDK